jgi:hypothetical protein
MFFEEKIDRLKRKFPPTDFKVPFTEGSSILKSIETNFIIIKDLNKDLNNLRQYFNNWADNIKHKTEVKSIDLNNHNAWLDKLDSNTNYWMVLAYGNSQSHKHLVFDCKPHALIALFYITQDDFFVIDKRYKWFSYFQVNKQTNKATIFRSGEKMTPFEI